MSKKYVIEINPEYEDSFKCLMILGAKDSNLFVDTLAVENLEELNSDYINEHFGDLQDEAYKRGLEEGKKATWGLVADASSAEYKRGLDDAWEAARKIVEMTDPPYWGVFNEYKNDLFGKITASEAIAKLKAYEEKQKAEDDIKLGDVLEHTVSGYTSKAIFLEKIEDDEDWYKCLFWTGCGLAILSYPKSQFKRIGKHFDIDKILEEMKE